MSSNRLTLIEQKELEAKRKIIVPEGVITDNDKKEWLRSPLPGGILQYIPNEPIDYLKPINVKDFDRFKDKE